MTLEEAISYLERIKDYPNIAYKDDIEVTINHLKRKHEESILDREIGGNIRYTDSTDWKG